MRDSTLFVARRRLAMVLAAAVLFAGPSAAQRLDPPKPAGKVGVTPPKPVSEIGFTAPKPVGEIGVTAPKPVGEIGFTAPKPVGEGGCSASYKIGPADILDVAIWNNAEMTRTVPVRPDGKISLPLLNDVQAAGLTPMELRDVLRRALTEYIPAATVSVLVKEIHSFKVTVIGRVKTPGRYELQDSATVVDVLAMAGGLSEYAARGRIAVMRNEGATTRQIPFPYDRLVAKSESKDGKPIGGPENFCVQPGDVILVP
jgi:polysaccharide export outer membrane protein